MNDDVVFLFLNEGYSLEDTTKIIRIFRDRYSKTELQSVSPLDVQTIRFMQVFLYPLSIAETSPETQFKVFSKVAGNFP
jgi:hypothetical protein